MQIKLSKPLAPTRRRQWLLRLLATADGPATLPFGRAQNDSAQWQTLKAPAQGSVYVNHIAKAQARLH